VVGVPNTGTLGTVEGGALEDSTVDIASEFTNLIVYQNSYEANSKVISTLDQVTQNLLNLQQ
jgi:flagellar hook protein FlgE